MPAKRKWTQEQLDSIREDFHSDLLNEAVAVKYGCDYNRSLKKFWIEWFGAEAVKDRFKRNCAVSKTAEKNPMFGKTLSKHHRHVPNYKTTYGYMMVDCPDWWEGPRKANKYTEHNIVGCLKYGLTKMPKGYVIHHIDDDKLNNHPDNLQLMTIAEHMRHHDNWRAGKVQRLSRKGVDPKRDRSAPHPEEDDDIV